MVIPTRGWMYALVQDVDVVSKLSLFNAFNILDGRIAEIRPLEPRALRVGGV